MRAFSQKIEKCSVNQKSSLAMTRSYKSSSLTTLVEELRHKGIKVVFMTLNDFHKYCLLIDCNLCKVTKQF